MTLVGLTVTSIIITIVNTIVGIIGIVTTVILLKKGHQKSNRPRQK